MLTKLLSVGFGLSVLACFFFYNLWENSQEELSDARANIAILNGVNDSNQKSLDRLSALAVDNALSIEKLGGINATILQQSLGHQTEVNNLRASEAQNALALPFERGNASRQRIVTQLLRFSGNHSSSHDTGNDKTGDPDGSKTTDTR